MAKPKSTSKATAKSDADLDPKFSPQVSLAPGYSPRSSSLPKSLPKRKHEAAARRRKAWTNAAVAAVLAVLAVGILQLRGPKRVLRSMLRSVETTLRH
jgi:hypothetical protein